MGVGSFDLIIRALPEILGVNTAGFLIYFNTTVWYISAMLIVMLPLCYILIKNRDFFIYVLAPIAALLSFGFMYNHYSNHDEDGYYFKLVLAISGLCFGVVAWIIYKKLLSIPDNKVYRIIVTIGELLAGGLFFYTWIFHICDQKTLFCAALLLPIIIAIAFSNKSYISRLFQFKWMQYCGSLSLAIFLNHWVAVLIANALMKGKSYWVCLVMIVVLTVVFSVINFVAVKIIKTVWNKIMSATNKLN